MRVMKLFCHALLALISTLGLSQANAAELVYFLVAEPPGRVVRNDSYVLPVSNQEDIDHACYLVSHGADVFLGSHAALVRVNVCRGKDGTNRTYVDPRLPECS